MIATLTVAALAQALGLPVPPSGADRVLTAIRPLDEAMREHLSFLDNPAYKAQAATTHAGAVLVREAEAALLAADVVALVSPNPYVSFAKALALFHPEPALEPGTAATAAVDESATVHPTARIEPGAVIGPNAVIGEGALIGAATVIGAGCKVGDFTRIGPGCTLVKTAVGKRCILHPGVRTGQDGFGFAQDGAQVVKVPQVGGVVIGDDVELGANTTVDCGALGDTVIEDMVKVDNQVQIGHNVRVGAGCRIVAQTGIAGSTRLGRHCVVGGQVGIAGHLAIADKVQIAAMSGVTKSIDKVGEVVAGTPAHPIRQWRREVAVLARLAKKGGGE